jgi:uncharacterized Zn finger protein
MDRKDWKELFAPRILQRGLAYYREGAVEMLQRKGDVVNAVVLGRERYRVEIGLKGDEITDWSCDCPYASEGTPCKHMAAVFYGLDNADREEAPGPREGQRSIRALIEGMDPEQAQALLLRLAERDTAVAEQIRSATEPPLQPAGPALEKTDRPTAAPGRRGAWVYRVRPGLGYDV